MICMRLQGGLGNQIFQYAAGQAIAAARADRVVFDTSHYRNQANRLLLLPQIGLDIPRLSAPQALWRRMFPDTWWGNRLHHRQSQLLPPGLQPCRNESAFPDLEAALRDPRRDLYLNGYWQDAHWFAAIATDLKCSLRRGISNLGIHTSTLTLLADFPVAVHVRRGDYTTARVQDGGLGPLPFSYYRAALALLTKKNGRIPRVALFSDDPSFVIREWNCEIPLVPFMEQAALSADPLMELALMSASPVLVIANSTLSWWAAWLRDNASVVAPQDWSGLGRATRGPSPLPGWMLA